MPEDIDISELDEIFEEATIPEKGDKTMNYTILNNPEQATELYNYLADKVESQTPQQVDSNGRARIVIKGVASRGWNASTLLNALLQSKGFTEENKTLVTITELTPANTNKVSSECGGISNALSQVTGKNVYLGIYSSKKGWFKFYPEYVEVERVKE